jgi:phosphopantetheinyl transferase (holo-ACP synthase)
MIGNDIVDLQLAAQQSNWQRKDFLDKIFTPYEQRLISKALDKEKMVWLLWSMKESAYKAYLQKYPKRFFAPKKLQCNLFTDELGEVIIKQEYFKTHSKSSENHIHTIAFSAKEKGNPISECFEVDAISFASKQLETRSKLKAVIAKEFKTVYNDLKISKNKVGVPQLFINEIQLAVSFSLSHHGRFGAFCVSKSYN